MKPLKILLIIVYWFSCICESCSTNNPFDYKLFSCNTDFSISNYNSHIIFNNLSSNIGLISDVITYKYSFPSLINSSENKHLKEERKLLHILYNDDDYESNYENIMIYSEDIYIKRSNIIKNCNISQLSINHICLLIEFEQADNREEFTIMYEYELENLIRQRENSFKGIKENIILWKISNSIGGYSIRSYSLDIFIS